MRNLKLDRPLVVLDLETTGIDVERDRIVQIGLVRIETDGRRRTFESLVNPQRPIPPTATAIHGITDRHVRDQPVFAALCGDLEPLLDGADLAGFNAIRFDLPLLETELRRAGSRLDLHDVRRFDALRIFHTMEPRDLSAAYRFYCGKELTAAHSALADATAALEVLDAQIAHYRELPSEPDALHRFCNPDEGRYVDRTRKFVWDDRSEAAFTFGKLRGRTLRESAADPSERGYLEWMLKSDFSEEVKAIVRDALGGTYPQRRA